MKIKQFMALALIACSAIFGTQALAAKPRHHRSLHHQYGFAVLKHGSAKISDTRQQFLDIPSSAVLAKSVGGDNIYVFQRVHKLEAQTCVADEGGAEMAGGSACGPTEAVEREGLSLIHPKPDGTQRLIVLIPNGVKTVSATTGNNGSSVATVANNVAVIEGNLTAYYFVSPSGSDVSVSLVGI
jgi:hypothetical protein